MKGPEAEQSKLPRAAKRPGLPRAGGKITRLACARLTAAGIDLQPLLRQARLTLRQVEDEEATFPVQSQIRLLDLAAVALNDDLLGFNLARTFDLREIGLLHYVMASAETLGDALRRVARYSRMINEGVSLTYRDGGDVSVVLAYAGVPRHSDRHQIEFWTIALVRLCRELTARRLSPHAVKFTHHRHEDDAEFNAFLGITAEFGAAIDEIVLAASAKAVPIVGADPYLHNLLVAWCEEALARRSSQSGAVRVQVENALAPLLPHGKVRASDIARTLGMSERTLARRLESEGTTFAAILDQLRCDLAQRHIRDPALSMSEIAWLLGYQEGSAFTHAFKRWTGKTPRQMRASVLGSGGHDVGHENVMIDVPSH